MRRLLLRSYWLGNAFIMVLVILFLGVFIRTDQLQDLGSLRAILSTASGWTLEASSNLQELADQIAASSPPLRVTFVMPNGIILADSGDTQQDGQALVARLEVQQALKDGTGQRITSENGLLYPTLYTAGLLEGKLILHLAYTSNKLSRSIYALLPALVFLAVILWIISRAALDPSINKLVHQLDGIRDLLEGMVERRHMKPQTYFPELRPVMEQISLLIDRMRFDLEEIRLSRNLQREFIDNASHELKSPLTSILGFAEMLHTAESLTQSKQREYVQRILSESQRMSGIVHSILQLQQAQSCGDDVIQVDVRKAAEAVAAILGQQALKRGISMHIAGEMCVLASEDDVDLLLRNLMSNAVRYGVPGGWVKVELGGDTLSVADNGIGIEPEHLPRIFEKFYRADKSRSRSLGGTGLGLSIVAAIVRKYGARIDVQSKPGQGSTFCVHFVRKV